MLVFFYLFFSYIDEMSGGVFQSDVSIIITDYHLVRPFSWFMQIFLDNLLKQELRGKLFCIFFIITLVVAVKPKYFTLTCGFKVTNCNLVEQGEMLPDLDLN